MYVVSPETETMPSGLQRKPRFLRRTWLAQPRSSTGLVSQAGMERSVEAGRQIHRQHVAKAVPHHAAASAALPGDEQPSAEIPQKEARAFPME